jgi:predicted flap endonuclease-1-like 5' DNA nuclease
LKKKTPEEADPHAREARIPEGYEKHTEPNTTPMSITGIPMQVIAPIPVPSLNPVELTSSKRKELRVIKGIDNETAGKLIALGIENIDDLAKASKEKLATELKVSIETAQKWIERAKQLT